MMKVMRLQIEFATFREDDMAKLYIQGERNAKVLAEKLGCSVSTVYRTFNSVAFANSLANHGVERPEKLSDRKRKL